MENEMIMDGDALYPVRCTECGEIISTKKFPLDNLLEQYHNGQEELAVVSEIVKMLGIRVEFGRAVLPEVPALFQDRAFLIPTQRELASFYTSAPAVFQCVDNELPVDELVPVQLNMSAIVAQFYMATGFYDIYAMLQFVYEREEADPLVGFDAKHQKILDRMCDSFAALPSVTLSGEMTTLEDRRALICDNFRQLLHYAKIDGELQDQGIHHSAMEKLFVGWRYKLVNGRNMPYSLVVRGSNGNTYDIEDCRCPNCGRRISYKMGAYAQKIVGLLGTQATGKTTYLAALTDAIQTGETTSLVESNGNMRLSDLTIQPCTDNDPQWERVMRQPKGSTVTVEDIFAGVDPSSDAMSGAQAGTLWLYQNGFPPEKTKVNTLDASALTFLISSANENSAAEPIMLTLADIPGEAFFDADQQQDEMLVKIQHKLLFSCSAIIMVISARQLMNEVVSGSEVSDKMVSSPSAILGAYEKFLPDHAVPTAVVLTACDEINHGDLRKALHLAYDVRKCPPLVWSDHQNTLVYNAGPMQTTVNAVWAFLNSQFGLFTENLSNILRRDNGEGNMDLAAFAVSNGTQYAKRSYSELNSEDVRQDEKNRKQRYQMVREGRFGVSGPLLWLLARNGMLKIGSAEPENSDNRPAVQDAIQMMLEDGMMQS